MPVVAKVKGPSFPIIPSQFWWDRMILAKKDVETEQAETVPPHNVLLTSNGLQGVPMLK